MAMLPPDPVYIFKGEMSPVTSLTFKITPFIQYIYAATQSGKIHVWDLQTNREIDNFQSSTESCLSLNLTNDDVLIAQDKSGVIKFWSKTDSKWNCLKEISTDYYGFCKCFLSDETLYCPNRESNMELVSIHSKKSYRNISFQKNDKLGEIMAFKVIEIKNEIYILIAFESGDLYLWDLEKRLKKSGIKFDDTPMAIDFDTLLMKGIYGSTNEKVIIFQIDKNFEFQIRKEIKLVNPGVACVAIRPDHKIVALGCWDGKLRLYSWKSLVILAVLDTHSSTVQDLGFFLSNDNRYYLAAGGKDTKVSLWDLYN